MADKAAVELQNKLAAFIEARGGPSPTRNIVADFRTAHPKEVEAAASTLYNLALTKLVDAVSRRRASGDPTQGDLFGRLKYPNAIVVHVAQAGVMRPMRKPFSRCDAVRGDGLSGKGGSGTKAATGQCCTGDHRARRAIYDLG